MMSMSSRQPSLTIPSVPTTESSADAWRRKAELSLHPLEQVDRDCVKRGSNCQQLREKFDAWKLHGPATTRDSVINLHSTPEHLECFRRLIEKIFYCNVNVSYLYAMVRVSLEVSHPSPRRVQELTNSGRQPRTMLQYLLDRLKWLPGWDKRFVR